MCSVSYKRDRHLINRLEVMRIVMGLGLGRKAPVSLLAIAAV